MNSLTGLAFAAAGSPLVRRVLGSGGDLGLTTLVYHGFFFGGETEKEGRDRLRRQLAWLREHYELLSLDGFNAALQAKRFPPRALFVTVDDANPDLVKVVEEFKTFGIPLTVYVCAGWTAQASRLEAGGLWARAVSELEWYQGPNFDMALGSESRVLSIGREGRAACIDDLLRARGYFEPHLEQLIGRLEAMNKDGGIPVICSWDQLRSLQSEGVSFGSHSVSHIKLAPASDVRLGFEVHESKRLIESHLGPCSSFAYPFGTAGTCDERTTAVLKAAGVTAAFLTHPEFAQSGDSAFHLPRFALPERHMGDLEYRGRVRGAGVMLRRLKHAVGSRAR